MSVLFAYPDTAIVCSLCMLPLVMHVIGVLRRRCQPGGVTAMALLAATLIPYVYVQARCRYDAQAVSELLEHSRYGEARTKVRQLLQLAPSMEWRGRSMKEIAREIDRTVDRLESQVATPVAPTASVEQRLLRCRQLAMLGRTGQALAQLAPLIDSPVRMQACDLCGRIHETTGEWETARGFHQRAKEEWSRQPMSALRRAGSAEAAMRLGYCERKLGNYELAEVEYCEALSLCPTADTHFLLARFYEDMQLSSKAHAHARRAMALDPERYRLEGTKLIENLTVAHFGCLNVFQSELQMDQHSASHTALQALHNPAPLNREY